MIKPIPKRLLPHNCVYKEYLGNQGEGDEWDKETTLSFVKIEEKTQLRITTNGREVVGNAKMFYDLASSVGLVKKPVQNSKIIFNNHEYTIEDLDTFYATSDIPHHYEVLLK